MKFPFFQVTNTSRLAQLNKANEVHNVSKIKPKNNSANMPNPNIGTTGTNRQYDQVHGNRGKQIQQNKQQRGAQ